MELPCVVTACLKLFEVLPPTKQEVGLELLASSMEEEEEEEEEEVAVEEVEGEAG